MPAQIQDRKVGRLPRGCRRAHISLLSHGPSWSALLLHIIILLLYLLVHRSESKTQTRIIRQTVATNSDITPSQPVQFLQANAHRVPDSQWDLTGQRETGPIGSNWTYPDDDSVSATPITNYDYKIAQNTTHIETINQTSFVHSNQSQDRQQKAVNFNSSSTQSQSLSSDSATNTFNTSVRIDNPLLIYSVRFEIRGYELRSATSQHKQNQHIHHQQPQSSSLSPSTRNEFSQIVGSQSISPKHSKTLIGGLKNTIGLDFFYEPHETKVFWTDVGEERIYKGVLSNGVISNVDILIQTGSTTAESLAVDWVGRNLYWVESTHLDHIEVSNMEGTARRTLLAGDMESPRAIALDPRHGLLFWTDWDKRYPRIERATMSGDQRRVLVNIKEVKGGWPNGLTLDYQQLQIYWIDANSDSIHVVDYDGSNHRRVLSHIKLLGHPFSITLFENNLYWTDWKTNSVSSANKFNGSEPRELQRFNSRLFDIKVVHSSRQPPVADDLNPCHVNKGNCSHLCLLSGNGTRRCECPHLMRLTSDGLSCEQNERFLLLGKTNEIRAVELAEPLHSVMTPISVPKVFSPRQFEFEAKSKTIFWADAQSNEVKRAQVGSGGGQIETIIDAVIEAPGGLALDWLASNLYVTSGSQHRLPGKVFVSNANGEFISVLMDYSHGILAPKSIAVHPILGLLFCVDETADGKPLIFSASMDGRNKRTIASRLINPRLDNPVSLAIDYQLNRLYWVNQLPTKSSEGSSVQYYDLTSDRIVTLLEESRIPIADRLNPSLIAVDGDHLILAGRVPQDTLFRSPRDDLSKRTILRSQSLDRLHALRVYDAPLQAANLSVMASGSTAAPTISGPCGINNGRCSQLCLAAGPMERTCACTIGYSLDPANETQCLGRPQFLLFSHNLGLKGVSLEPNSSPDDYFLPPIHKAFRASSIDFLYREQLIYWVDNEEGSISRIRRDTTNHQLVVQGLESEESIALDWVAGNVYWLSPYHDVIEVALLDGSKRYVIITGDMDKPNGLAVNPLSGYLVWSDAGASPRIETAKLDGSQRRTIVATDLARVDDLAIDLSEDLIYWLDSALAVVERCREDGSQRQLVFRSHSNQAAHSQLVSIAVHEQYLYVADSVLFQGSISRIDKSGFASVQSSQANSVGSNLTSTGTSTTNPTQLVVQVNLGDGIRDMAVFGPQPMPSPEMNPCVSQNGGCQDLCLYTGVPGRRRCICSHGRLAADGQSCRPLDTFLVFSRQTRIDSLQVDSRLGNSPYPAISFESSKSSIVSLTIDYPSQRLIYSDLNRNQICSVFFNGTDRRVLVDNQSLVEGITFSNDQLYWTSVHDNSISRLNISSVGLESSGCSQIHANGSHSQHLGCNQATSGRSLAVERLVRLGDDDKPRGIAIDICSQFVYWTNWNALRPAIQRASPTTGYKVESIIITDIKVPNGIAVDHKQRKLYWCDARLDKIELADMDGSHRLVLGRAVPQHPFALAIWNNYVFWTDWLANGVFRADKFTGESPVQMKKLSQRPMGITVASSDWQSATSCPQDACSLNNGGCPAGHTCLAHPWAAKLGRPTVECRPSTLAHELTLPIFPVRCKHWRDSTSDCEHSNYHHVLLDSLERYNTKRYNITDLMPVETRDTDFKTTTTTVATNGSSFSELTSQTGSENVNLPQELSTPSSVGIQRETSGIISAGGLNTQQAVAQQTTIVDSTKPGHESRPTSMESQTNSTTTSPTTINPTISNSSTKEFNAETTTTPVSEHTGSSTQPPIQSSTLNPTSSATPTPASAQNSTSTTVTPNLKSNSTGTTTSVSAPNQPTAPPCQIVPAALQTTTTDSSAADCGHVGWFKCYLSDRPADCIPPERRCDGNYDCPSKEDENDCYLSKRGPYKPRRDSNWHHYVTLILVILAAAVAALFLVFGTRGRRGRWFLAGAGFNHRRMFDDTGSSGTNIEISNPMFDDDNDTTNLTHCAFSIDLSERTTNFSNPLYERQVLLMGDKRSAPQKGLTT